MEIKIAKSENIFVTLYSEEIVKILVIDNQRQEKTIEIADANFDKKLLLLKEIDLEDSLYFSIYNFKGENIIGYIKDSNLYISFENIAIMEDMYIQIENKCNDIKIDRINIDSFSVTIFDKEVFLLKDFFSLENSEDEKFIIDVPEDLNIHNKYLFEDREYNFFAKMSYNNYYIFFELRCEGEMFIQVSRRKITACYIPNSIELKMCDSNRLFIEIDSLLEQKCDILEIVNNPYKLGRFANKKRFPESIISVFKINQNKYYIFIKNKKIYIQKGNEQKIIKAKLALKFIFIQHYLFIFGYFVCRGYKADQNYDKLYFSDNVLDYAASFVRPFKNIKFLKNFGFYKINVSDLQTKSIHNVFWIGNNKFTIRSLKLFNGKREKIKIHNQKIIRSNTYIFRTNLGKKCTLTILPYTKEYSFSHRFKRKLALFLSKIFVNKDESINLYFEKKSEKADESAYRVFKYVMDYVDTKAENYFILDKTAKEYTELKKMYPTNILEKYSFKHYLKIFQSSTLISSELANHVLNDRVFIREINDKLKKTTLIFLQHGIMFAKPVENPMAFGFRKENIPNLYKTIISSELESLEFFKLGYSKNDLLKSGLATLDYAKRDMTSNKIVVMLTYRFWEEYYVYNDRVKETSYYRTIKKIIKQFESVGLIDRLIIVPHNKFTEYVGKEFVDYNHIFMDNPTKALEIAQVFITDYSSAIYDAIYRGAYPIFYWEEKAELCFHYKSSPPVNEENAPGQIAYNVEELSSLVLEAEYKNYILEDEYMDKYKMINEFSDGNNTKRIVDFLKKEKIL